MTFWVDAQLSPRIARWLADTYGVTARPVRDIGLRDAEDADIFLEARKAGAVIISKDNDFVSLLERHGSPPQLIWLTCGNTSDAELQRVFAAQFREAMRLLIEGESLVEIGPI